MGRTFFPIQAQFQGVTDIIMDGLTEGLSEGSVLRIRRPHNVNDDSSPRSPGSGGVVRSPKSRQGLGKKYRKRDPIVTCFNYAALGLPLFIFVGYVLEQVFDVDLRL